MSRLFKTNTLFCFSPPVMVATILIELALAGWTVTRYGLKRPYRLIILILALLASFQLAEYNVCGHSSTLGWARFGYVAIISLPILSLHLVTQLRAKKQRILLAAGYISAAIFTLVLLIPGSITGATCPGNYVIFTLPLPLFIVYTVYYLGFGLLGLILALKPSEQSRLALKWLAAGYLTIGLSTLIILVILPSTHVAAPSIMCGFAVIFALILGLRVAPLAKS